MASDYFGDAESLRRAQEAMQDELERREHRLIQQQKQANMINGANLAKLNGIGSSGLSGQGGSGGGAYLPTTGYTNTGYIGAGQSPVGAQFPASSRRNLVGPFTEDQFQQLRTVLHGRWEQIHVPTHQGFEYYIELSDNQGMTDTQKGEYQQGYDKGFEDGSVVK